MSHDSSLAPAPLPTPVRHRELGDWTFHVFLLVLLLSVVVSPVLADIESLLVVQRRATAVVLITGLVVLRRRHRDWIIGVLLILPALIGDFLNDELGGAAHAVGQGSAILYLLFLAGLIAYRIFHVRRVSSGTISAALCVYLVTAVAWGGFYDLIDTFESSPSFIGVQPATEADTPLERQQRSANLQYFSVVTITTLGYGDIVPTSHLARGLATLEAFFGQMFLAVLVARLVSMYAMEQRRSEPDPA